MLLGIVGAGGMLSTTPWPWCVERFCGGGSGGGGGGGGKRLTEVARLTGRL